VGVPVASAILALVFPEKYSVIDFRGWRQVFGEERTTFSVSDYRRYLTEIQKLAQELGWIVQEVDLAIWEYDRINS
jgi:2C-methyl-D-erythritol 2,4-cyclodiphosphate synthase